MNDVTVIVAGYMDLVIGVEQSLMLALGHIPWIVQALS
jgi:hypothetical protein